MRKFVLFLILLCFLFSGCVTIRQKKYVQKHPQLKEWVKDAILEGKVGKGMTKSQVLASWGEPEKKGKAGLFALADEEWVYDNGSFEKDRFGDYAGWEIKRHVFFVKEKVIKVKDRSHIGPSWLF